MPSRADVVARCSSDALRLVRLLYVGNDGVLRGHAVDSNRIAHSFDHGENLATVVQSLTASDVVAPAAPFDATGEVRLVPDPTTFRSLPYADRTAAMICHLEALDGSPWAADPRSRLSAYLDSIADRGLTPRIGFESEFYLLDDRRDTEGRRPRPVDDTPCYAAEGMQTVHDVVLATIDALDELGISTAGYHPELGPGQQELVADPRPALDAVEEYLFFRPTVRAVARDHGLDATFAPKPIADAAGSGCHVHLSMWTNDENAFVDDESHSPYGLDETARHFVGGLLEHAPALVGLTAASVQSYDRLRPSSWAAAYTCWGEDNREALVRVPSADRGRRAATTRIEFKPADHTANPYLSVLGILAAGLDGIDGRLDPGDPVEVDPATMTAADRTRSDIDRLPETLGAALDALESDDVLADALGDSLLESYLGVKRAHLESARPGSDDSRA